MIKDLDSANEVLLEFQRLIETNSQNPWSGSLRTGVDLGTANIVLAVVDSENRPVAGASFPSTVVKDGIVVDYLGAIRVVRRLKAELEERLGTSLTHAAAAIPPGVAPGSVRAIGNVVEGSDFHLTGIMDEPTAAATVLRIDSGAVVDVGGGTTGISILENGKVVFSADEPTGGTHMTLVLSGSTGLSIKEAEKLKKDAGKEAEIFAVVRPVVEKMAAIVRKYIAGRQVEAVYVVGGACSFHQFEAVFEQSIGVPIIKPAAPLLVTPLGIAMNCEMN
jgi:ethanolamine utilization protein EutJ